MAFRSSMDSFSSSISNKALRISGYSIFIRESMIATIIEDVGHEPRRQKQSKPILLALLISKSVVTFCLRGLISCDGVEGALSIMKIVSRSDRSN